MTAQRPTRVRWVVLVLACGTSWLLYLHRYAWGVIKPDVMEEFDLSPLEIGWVDSAFNITYALCQVPTGLLGDLLGPAFVLPLIIVIWSLGLAAFVFGVGTVSFIALRSFFGIAQAGTYPNLGKVTRSWFPLSQRTTMQGLIASFSGRMGGACAPLIVGTLFMGTFHLGWRATLWWLAGVGVVYAVILRLFFRNSPHEHPGTNEAERRLIEADEPPTTGVATPIRFDTSWPVMVSFGGLLAQIFLSAFADQLFVYWIFTFLVEAKNLSKADMGIYGSLPLFGGAAGGLVAGILIDWILRQTKKRRLSRSLVGFVGKFLSAVLVLASLLFEDGKQMMLVVMVGKFFTDWTQPAMWATMTDVGGRASGSVFGMVNMAGSIGAFLAGPIIGAIVEFYGWDALFITIAGIYVAASFCWFFINADRPVVLDSLPPSPDDTESQTTGELGPGPHPPGGSEGITRKEDIQ